MENEYIYSEEFQSYGDKLKNGLTDYVTLESKTKRPQWVVCKNFLMPRWWATKTRQ